MSEIVHTPAPPVASADAKRRLRNYLLDARFQLKFTGYILLTSLVIAAVLGAFLWSTSNTLMHEATMAVEARQRAAQTSKELGNATLANELFQRFDDPAFEAQLEEKSAAIDAQYEAEHQAIVQQRGELVRKQRLVWLTLVACLVGFVVFIALASIVTTHKIVGPLYRIKRLVNEVAAGHLKVPTYPLRDKDELKDTFEALTRMIHSLREQRVAELKTLGEAIDRARASGQESLANELQTVYASIKSQLG